MVGGAGGEGMMNGNRGSARRSRRKVHGVARGKEENEEEGKMERG